MNIFFCILFLLFSPGLYCSIGNRVLSLTGYCFQKKKISIQIPVSFRIILGLLTHLALLYVFRLCQIPWAPAFFLAMIPGLLVPGEVLDSFREMIPRPSFNTAIWVAVVLSIGITLFEYHTDGIVTAWRNNYGDLTYHFGMIHSLLFQGNFPPENHIFAGELLSYPFFINFWTTSFWWMSPDYQTLSLIFLFQWCFIWFVCYALLNGFRNWLLPWALLFGGGSYFVLGKNSGELIGQNIPWTTFLSTIWVPQRTAMFGLAVIITAVLLFERALKEYKEHSHNGNALLFLSGLTLALSPLVHSHFILVAALFLGLRLVCSLDISSKESKISSLKKILIFLLPFFCSLLFIPLLLGKQGLFHWKAGWVTGQANTLSGTERLFASAEMWFQSGLTLLFALLFLVIFTRKYLSMGILFVLFLLGNIVQIAIWEWDQIKIFLALYSITLTLLSVAEVRWRLCFQVLLLILFVPGVYEAYTIVREPPRHTVYTQNDIQIATTLKSKTAPEAIIAGAPDHNSPITLSGRTFFYGYEGTLFSHGLQYQERKKFMETPESLLQCNAPECPDYLLWTERERRRWNNRVLPPSGYQAVAEGVYVFPKGRIS